MVVSSESNPNEINTSVSEERGAIIATAGEAKRNLESIDREFELAELREKQEGFAKRIERIEKRVRKVCPDEFAKETTTV